MNLRYILSICVICCFSLKISAQTVEKFDIITLTDGSILNGVLLNENSANAEIRLTSGAQISIPANSIKNIKAGKDNHTYFSNGKSRKNKGYFGFVKTGLLFRRYASDYFDIVTSPGVQTVHGYRFNKKLSAGIGVGMEGFDRFKVLPIFAHLRYEPFDKRVRPYLSIDAGYGVALNSSSSWNEYSGGLMLQSAIGLQFSNRSGGGIFLELGQKFQWATEESAWNGNVNEWRFSRAAFNVGYLF